MTSRQICALAIDSELQKMFDRSTSSTLVEGPVYRKAAYFLWPNRGPVVLLSRDQSPQPWTVITDVKEFSHTSGTEALLKKNCLYWGQKEIVLSPNKRDVFDSHIPDLSQNWSPVHLQEMRSISWGSDNQSLFSHLGVLNQSVSHKVTTLGNALLHSDRGQLEAVVRSLVGLGYGATPTGDDFLTGLLGALASRKHPYFYILSQVTFGLPLLASNITTLPGGISLWHACQQRFAAVISDAVLAMNGLGDVTKTTIRLVQVGHTSGRDILAGLCVGAAL